MDVQAEISAVAEKSGISVEIDPLKERGIPLPEDIEKYVPEEVAPAQKTPVGPTIKPKATKFNWVPFALAGGIFFGAMILRKMRKGG